MSERKIDDDTALEIFKLALTGKYTYEVIATKFDLSKPYITGLLRRDYGLRHSGWIKIRNRYISEEWENYKGTYKEFCQKIWDRYKLSNTSIRGIIAQNGSSIISQRRGLIMKQIQQLGKTNLYSFREIGRRLNIDRGYVSKVLGGVKYPIGSIRACLYCGNSFEVTRGRHQFCNNKCYDVSRRKLKSLSIHKVCVECGETFYPKYYSDLWKDFRFCSSYCWALYRKRQTEIKRKDIVRMFKNSISKEEIASIKKRSLYNINYMLRKQPLQLPPTGWTQYDKWLPSKFSTSRARTQAIRLAKAQIKDKESNGGKIS